MPHVASLALFLAALLLLAWAVHRAQGLSRRLRVMNAVASVAVARQDESRVQSVLRQICAYLDAKGAWFQMIEGDYLLVKHQVDVPDYLWLTRSSVARNSSLVLPLITSLRPRLVNVHEFANDFGEDLRRAGYSYILFVPIENNGELTGILALAFCRKRQVSRAQMEFLALMAGQLGLARENLSMVERVLQTQRQWLGTIDSLDDAILIHDADLQVLRINQTMARRLGSTPARLAGRKLASVLPHAEKGCPYCDVAGMGEVADPCFGGYALVSTSAYVDERSGRPGKVHTICDRTERRAAEERYRLLFESVQEGVFVSTLEGTLIDCNSAFATMLGFASREEVVKINTAEFFRSAAEREAYTKALEAQGALRNYEIALRRSDGSEIAALENSFAIRGAEGRIERIQGFLLDVTDKKRVEEDLRRRNHELAALNSMAAIANRSFSLAEILASTMRHLGDLYGQQGDLLIFDSASGRLLRSQSSRAPEAHQALRTVLEGLSDKLRRAHSEMVTEADIPRLPREAQEWLEKEGCHSLIGSLMYSQGELLGMIILTAREPGAFGDTDRGLAMAIGRQLSSAVERVRLYEEATRAYDNLRATQEQLLQSEKMSAVGQLISGVAHELNNPLTAILGYAQLLESLPIGEQALGFVRKLYQQTKRTHRVVQNLLAFSRQRKPIQSQVDLQRVLEDTLALREFDLKINDIEVRRDYQPGAPFITGDAHQLSQVFLNIVNNAVDAIMDSGHGGKLLIRLKYDAANVNMEFLDSGPGLHDAGRIFDPFYTTKGVGRGTGLGLSICYGIVKEHGGNISAGNGELGGAVFRITLPVNPPQKASAGAIGN
ncbi:MAG: PAS domain S-box protein [Acidobacteriota bacterium]|nr:PAS domain S-box protein [Acidobacteriota bacterium]